MVEGVVDNIGKEVLVEGRSANVIVNVGRARAHFESDILRGLLADQRTSRTLDMCVPEYPLLKSR
jgi:hypothetical protein